MGSHFVEQNNEMENEDSQTLEIVGCLMSGRVGCWMKISLQEIQENRQ